MDVGWRMADSPGMLLGKLAGALALMLLIPVAGCGTETAVDTQAKPRSPLEGRRDLSVASDVPAEVQFGEWEVAGAVEIESTHFRVLATEAEGWTCSGVQRSSDRRSWEPEEFAILRQAEDAPDVERLLRMASCQRSRILHDDGLGLSYWIHMRELGVDADSALFVGLLSEARLDVSRLRKADWVQRLDVDGRVVALVTVPLDPDGGVPLTDCQRSVNHVECHLSLAAG